MKPPKRDKPSKRLIDLDEVIDKVPVTRQTPFNWERDTKFPKRISLNGDSSRICWLESEVDEWIDQRAAARWDHLPPDERPGAGAVKSDALQPAE